MAEGACRAKLNDDTVPVEPVKYCRTSLGAKIVAIIKIV